MRNIWQKRTNKVHGLSHYVRTSLQALLITKKVHYSIKTDIYKSVTELVMHFRLCRENMILPPGDVFHSQVPSLLNPIPGVWKIEFLC